MFLHRTITPFLGLLVATALSAAVHPDGEHQGPPHPPAPEKMFEHFDADHDQALSRAEFFHGMAEMAQRRAEHQDGERRAPGAGGDGERPARPPGDGERPARPPGDGERPARPHGDGERPARPPGDGERPARPHGDGERPARPPGDGEGRPRPGGEGQPLDGAFVKADADKNGTLSLAEFKAALEAMPHPQGQRPPPRDGDAKPEHPRPPKDQ